MALDLLREERGLKMRLAFNETDFKIWSVAECRRKQYELVTLHTCARILFFSYFILTVYGCNLNYHDDLLSSVDGNAHLNSASSAPSSS